MQLKVGETYHDPLRIKWTIIQKLPSGCYVGFSHEKPQERIRKFDNAGHSYGTYWAQFSLQEIKKEWFGIEVSLDGERKLVNGTWQNKEEATKQANESWWKNQPKVVRLYAEEIK